MSVRKERIYLVSYRPLVSNRAGREAIRRFAIPAFVDHSCRRELDLESPFPSISALCRATRFAPRLKKGNLVVYITKKDRYLCQQVGHCARRCPEDPQADQFLQLWQLRRL